MNILCLMPTYGRRRSLLEESIQCFVNQEYRQKSLLIYDDLGTLAETKFNVPDIHVMSTPFRSSSVGRKYNVMTDFAIAMSMPFDAVAVWDDDDIYLPYHLCTHAEILADHQWSKPSRIVSAYFDPPKEEDARGRFHGSIAVRRDLLTKAPWIDTTRATFDQEYLQQLQSHCPPGDPCDLAPPQYVYRWQTSGGGHCSGLMGSPTWYADYQPDSPEPITELTVRGG